MDFQAALEKLEARRRTLQALGGAYIALYVIGFALAIFSLLWGLLLIVCNGVLFLVFLRPKTKRYQHEVTKNALCFGLCAGMTDFRCSKKQEVSDTVLRELPLLPGDGSQVLCREGFTARSEELTVAGNEISLNYKASETEKGGLNYHFWSGTLLEFTWQTGASPMPLCTLLDRRLAEPDVLAALESGGLGEQKLADSALAEHFVLLQGGAQAVPSAVLRRVKRLVQATEKGLAVCLKERRLAVFINNRFYAQKVPVKHRVSEDLLRALYLPEQGKLLELVRCCAGYQEAPGA